MKKVKCPSCDRDEWEFPACDETNCACYPYRELARLRNEDRKKKKPSLEDIKKLIPTRKFPEPFEQPMIPMWPNAVPNTPGDQPWMPYVPSDPSPRHCPTCGIEIGRVMGYVCVHHNCPSFPRVVC